MITNCNARSSFFFLLFAHRSVLILNCGLHRPADALYTYAGSLLVGFAFCSCFLRPTSCACFCYHARLELTFKLLRAFLCASWHAHLRLTELLLQCPASPPACCACQGSPLKQAVQSPTHTASHQRSHQTHNTAAQPCTSALLAHQHAVPARAHPSSKLCSHPHTLPAISALTKHTTQLHSHAQVPC